VAIQPIATLLYHRNISTTRSDIKSCTDGDELVVIIETVCDMYGFAIDARMHGWATAVIDAFVTFPIDDLLLS
jgi:hypothetical protein